MEVVNPAAEGAAREERAEASHGRSEVGSPNNWAAGSEPRRARREGGIDMGRALGGNMRLGRREVEGEAETGSRGGLVEL